MSYKMTTKTTQKKEWMQFVEPIRDPKKIEQIKNQLRWANNIRDLLLFHLGINSALRISDLLSLQVHHIIDEHWAIREEFSIQEDKTGKYSKVTITPKLKETIELYISTYPQIIKDSDYYLFFRQKTNPLGSKHIDRRLWWSMISEWCKWVWLKGSYGGHTLRKTRWYQARMKWISMEQIQHKLNHSSLSITKKYLWINDDEMRDVNMRVDL